MKKYIFFDLDGTLTKSDKGIFNGIKYALAKFNTTIEDESVLVQFIGPPLIDSFKQFCDFSDEKAKEALIYYREYFSEIGIFENELYDGVPTLLEELKKQGKVLALTTSKPEHFAEIILKHFHIFEYFDIVTGSGLDGTRPHKIDVIRHNIQLLNSPDPNEIVMIGDRKYDIEAAMIAGISSIGVLYGYGDREELMKAGADKIAETLEDILKYLG